MNRYTYGELREGHSESFQITVTENMMASFGDITGDRNPLHMDDEYARASGGGKYTGKVAYGMLTASFLSALAGMWLPGETALIHKVEAEFPAPVHVGDTLTFAGEIVRKDDRFQILELKVTATNSHGKKVLRGKMQVGVLK